MVHLLPRGTLGHSTVLDGTLGYLWGTHGYYMVHLLASAPLARVTLARLRRTLCSARPLARDMHRSSIVQTNESCDGACHVRRICGVRRAIRSRVWLRCSRKRSSPSSTRTANPGAPATLPHSQHAQRTPRRARCITPRTCAACFGPTPTRGVRSLARLLRGPPPHSDAVQACARPPTRQPAPPTRTPTQPPGKRL